MKIATNKKAKFDYEILETFKAGLVLQGNEVKSIREGKVSIKESYVKIINNEAFLMQSNIAKFTQDSAKDYQEVRPRKLLLSKKEILKLQEEVKLKNLTIIPLDIYFDRKYVKITIALGRGKKKFDKRQTLKERDTKRKLEKTMKLS